MIALTAVVVPVGLLLIISSKPVGRLFGETARVAGGFDGSRREAVGRAQAVCVG